MCVFEYIYIYIYIIEIYIIDIYIEPHTRCVFSRRSPAKRRPRCPTCKTHRQDAWKYWKCIPGIQTYTGIHRHTHKACIYGIGKMRGDTYQAYRHTQTYTDIHRHTQKACIHGIHVCVSLPHACQTRGQDAWTYIEEKPYTHGIYVCAHLPHACKTQRVTPRLRCGAPAGETMKPAKVEEVEGFQGGGGGGRGRGTSAKWWAGLPASCVRRRKELRGSFARAFVMELRGGFASSIASISMRDGTEGRLCQGFCHGAGCRPRAC